MTQDELSALAFPTPGKPATAYANNPGVSSLMISSMLAGGISSIGGGVSSYFSQRASGEYQQSIAAMNAKFAEFEGTTALYKGGIMASQRDIAAKQAAGRGRAMTGASGASVNMGSPAATRIGVTGAGEQDQLMIRANAMRTALGYKSEAVNYGGQGDMARISGDFGATESLMTGGARAISGPLQTYGIYDRMRVYAGSR